MLAYICTCEPLGLSSCPGLFADIVSRDSSVALSAAVQVEVVDALGTSVPWYSLRAVFKLPAFAKELLRHEYWFVRYDKISTTMKKASNICYIYNIR